MGGWFPSQLLSRSLVCVLYLGLFADLQERGFHFSPSPKEIPKDKTVVVHELDSSLPSGASTALVLADMQIHVDDNESSVFVHVNGTDTVTSTFYITNQKSTYARTTDQMLVPISTTDGELEWTFTQGGRSSSPASVSVTLLAVFV